MKGYTPYSTVNYFRDIVALHFHPYSVVQIRFKCIKAMSHIYNISRIIGCNMAINTYIHTYIRGVAMKFPG